MHTLPIFDFDGLTKMKNTSNAMRYYEIFERNGYKQIVKFLTFDIPFPPASLRRCICWVPVRGSEENKL